MKKIDGTTRLTPALLILIPVLLIFPSLVAGAGLLEVRVDARTDASADDRQPVRQTEIARKNARNIIQHYRPADLGVAVTDYQSDAIPVPIDVPEPFLAVAGSWQTDTGAPGRVDFDIRFSRDGEAWSDWLHASHDHYEKVVDGLHHGELVFADKKTRFVQYRVRLDRDRNGRTPAISEVRLHFISPGASDPELLETIEGKRPENRGAAFTGTSDRPLGQFAADQVLAGLPVHYLLEQNYPNPFNTSTVIRYELPESAPVRLDVFTVTGRRVARLVDERQAAGAYQIPFDASALSSGVYIYRLQAGTYVSSRQMTLIK